MPGVWRGKIDDQIVPLPSDFQDPVGGEKFFHPFFDQLVQGCEHLPAVVNAVDLFGGYLGFRG